MVLLHENRRRLVDVSRSWRDSFKRLNLYVTYLYDFDKYAGDKYLCDQCDTNDKYHCDDYVDDSDPVDINQN